MPYQSQRVNGELLTGTAMHEAGHVVSALALGFEVRYSIVRSRRGRVSGYTEHVVIGNLAGEPSDRSRELLGGADMVRRRVIQALAGELAERMLINDHEVDLGATDDWNFACRLIAASAVNVLPPAGSLEERSRSVLEGYWDESQQLLHAHREAVIVVANQLLGCVNQKVYGRFFRL